MNRLLRQAAIPLALSYGMICLSCGGGSSKPSSSASSSSAGGSYMICYTQSNAHGVTVSSVFHIPPVDQVTMLEEPWAKDFRTHVAQSGDEGAVSVTCVPVDPKNPEGALKDKIDAWRKQGIQVGQTNWKYAGG
jgi:hypothetical protein